ncbi:MAG: TraC family protein [Pseudomonadota bacterium]
MTDHLKVIAKPGGLFHDDGVNQTGWRCQSRRMHLVLYHWLAGKKRQAGERQRGLSLEQTANQVNERLAAPFTAGYCRASIRDHVSPPMALRAA